MAVKSSPDAETRRDTPLDLLAQFQQAGQGNMMGISTAWMETMGDLGAEMASFVAARIKEDVRTQHEILHCKDMGELQRIQSEFIQRALEQYRAETGKLTEMGSKALASRSDNTES